MVPFDRSHCKLSENQKIIEIRFTELKLMATERVPGAIEQGEAVITLVSLFQFQSLPQLVI